jgi:peptidoglycan hydrolase-like amidase
VRFVDYVREVLPNEWIASWPSASLEAGAVAAKQFAWYNAFVVQKWRRYGYHFDLLDSTCDQVYKPGTAHVSTDAAIASTWWLVLTRNGALFETGYRNWYARCPQNGNCMGQWDSKELADAGWTSDQILLNFYSGSIVEEVGTGPVGTPPPPVCSSTDDPTHGPETNPTPVPAGNWRVYLPAVVNCS